MERSNPGIVASFAVSAVAMAGVAWSALARTGLESERASEDARPLAEGFSRRFAFFGHTEFSDLLDALGILSESVDAFSNAAALRGRPDHPIRKRLVTGLGKLPALTGRHLGMSEIYTLPAMYFLFEEESPREAVAIVRQGVGDPRLHPNVTLLAAFISHVFLGDLAQAGRHYIALGERPGLPDWPRNLGERLARGEDPYLTQPALRGELCRVIRKAFPRSLRYLEARAKECGDATGDSQGGARP